MTDEPSYNLHARRIAVEVVAKTESLRRMIDHTHEVIAESVRGREERQTSVGLSGSWVREV